MTHVVRCLLVGKTQARREDRGALGNVQDWLGDGYQTGTSSTQVFAIAT